MSSFSNDIEGSAIYKINYFLIDQKVEIIELFCSIQVDYSKMIRFRKRISFSYQKLQMLLNVFYLWFGHDLKEFLWCLIRLDYNNKIF
jgi:hypothetical protein